MSDGSEKPGVSVGASAASVEERGLEANVATRMSERNAVECASEGHAQIKVGMLECWKVWKVWNE